MGNECNNFIVEKTVPNSQSFFLNIIGGGYWISENGVFLAAKLIILLNNENTLFVNFFEKKFFRRISCLSATLSAQLIVVRT